MTIIAALLGRWGLSFLAPLVPYVLAATLALAFITGVYRTGYNAAWRQAQVETLKAKIATQEQDLRIAHDAEEQSRQKGDELTRQSTDLQEQIDALNAEVAKKPVGDRCGITDDDVRRLRGIGTRRGGK